MATITVTAKYNEPGVDQLGNTWIEFNVDYLAEQLPGICAECGIEIESGWLCLDGGDEVCDGHVELKEESHDGRIN